MREYRPRTCRRGITLLETLGTLAVLLTIAVTAARLLGTVTDIGQRSNRSRQSQRAVMQFSEQFRSDVSNAENVSGDDESDQLSILRDGTVVLYQWDASNSVLQRIVERDQQVISADRYALTPDCDPEYSITNDRVSVVIRAGKHPWVVEASR